MKRSSKLLLAACTVIWLLVVGGYLGNPLGTATWDPRGRLFGHVPYRIPSRAMSPTLQVDDIVISKTYVFAWSDPKLKDVLVFVSPTDNKTPFIKRVLGVPGDEVGIQDGVLYVNGKVVSEPYLADVVAKRPFSVNFPRVKVPPAQYFVLGDNRDNSHDSRFWGFVPRSSVIGRVDSIFYARQAERAGDLDDGS